MKKLFPISIAACLVLIILWQLFFADTSFYFISVAVIILSMLPFFVGFERAEHTARELTMIAGLTALAIVSRAVFYLIPQVKPIAAIVGISGVCLGARRGYIVGCFSMLISNFIFGQGPWTPFQMVAMGLVGLIFGLVFKKREAKRLSLCIVGFISTLIYGLIVDCSSAVFFAGNDISLGKIAAIFASGIPFNLVFAVTTVVCLALFGEQFICKMQRINAKYAITDIEPIQKG